MSDFPCVLPHRHDPERQRSAMDGGYVCRGCHARMEQTLAELPAQHQALTGRLAATGSSRMAEQVTGSRERPLPINLTVADHREHIVRVTASWASLTAEERGMALPHSDLPSVCAWLLRHLEWACAQPWVDDYAAELSTLRGRALSLLYPTGRRRVDIGPCVEQDCAGTLVATIAPVDDLLPGSIDCDTDPEHHWSPSEWHALSRRLLGPVVLQHAGVQALVKRLSA